MLAPHLRVIAEKLLAVARGDIRRLLISCPPRHGKSLLTSQYFPAWYLGTHPDHRVILTSYQSDFAATWGRKVRDILAEHGPALYGITVSADSAAADRWDIDQHLGGMVTAGVGAAITGRGANCLLLDDPLKNAAEAGSQTIRDHLWDWYTSTAYTRLEPDGAVVVIATRWHEDDLTGRLLKAEADGIGEHWEQVILPAIADTDESLPLPNYTYHRNVGEALWPERYGVDDFTRIRANVGERVWSSLYQQRPTPDAGLIWRRPWFDHRYSETPTILQTIQSVDSAFKTGVANDYSVIATWGRTATDYYLLDLWRARVEFPDLKRAIVDQSEKWRPSAILIEDAASGQSAIQELKRGTRLPIIPVPVKASKQTRAAVVSPLAESGKVWLPTTAPWVAAWIEEHIAFPNGEHDDVVDTTSMALAYLAHGRSHASSLLTHLDARLSGKE